MNLCYPHGDPVWDRIPTDHRPHVVYELWHAGECEYVGVTVNLPRRLKEHRPRIQWDEVRTTATSSRLSAEGLEARLIFMLRPHWNLRWNPEYDRSLVHRKAFGPLLEALPLAARSTNSRLADTG